MTVHVFFFVLSVWLLSRNFTKNFDGNFEKDKCSLQYINGTNTHIDNKICDDSIWRSLSKRRGCGGLASRL